MNGLSPSRRLILAEYEKLKASSDYGRVNIVRTIAVRIGYALDENRSNAYVRRVLVELGVLS